MPLWRLACVRDGHQLCNRSQYHDVNIALNSHITYYFSTCGGCFLLKSLVYYFTIGANPTAIIIFHFVIYHSTGKLTMHNLIITDKTHISYLRHIFHKSNGTQYGPVSRLKGIFFLKRKSRSFVGLSLFVWEFLIKYTVKSVQILIKWRIEDFLEIKMCFRFGNLYPDPAGS